MRKKAREGLEIRLSVLESLKPESEDDQRSIERNVRHVKRVLGEAPVLTESHRVPNAY